MNRVFVLIRGLRQINGKDIIRISFVVILLTAVTLLMMFSSYSENVNKNLADNLIRLHVIANSDSPEDQALKLKVRDKILIYMKEQLAKSRDIEETKAIIKRDIPKIEEISKAEIAKNQKEYPVKARLGVSPFPTKLYGDIALPAGNYQALKVEIGKAEGANWWCVLFPPLCFVDATHGTVPDSVKSELKSRLNEDEYRMVASAKDEDDIPIKVKFKIVEVFQNSKIKVSGMLSKLFK